ncbi:MAG: hypothetical protein MJZ30_11585 [Paludibacteraceae bacterium]|nr:hypothetical protein [Paludibacteraceae bacterium]
MAKKQNYQKYSNIENYCCIDHKNRSTHFFELPGSDVAQRINDLTTHMIDKGYKHPYLRFMTCWGEDKFICYLNTNTKDGKPMKGVQTFESVRAFLEA